MTVNYRFYKTLENRWYADIPEWTGSIDELEMVCGADIMLEIMAQGETEIYLSLGDKRIEGGSALMKFRETPDVGGAEYIFTSWKGIEYNMNIWLCDVTRWVFGTLPNTIYVI